MADKFFELIQQQQNQHIDIQYGIFSLSQEYQEQALGLIGQSQQNQSQQSKSIECLLRIILEKDVDIPSEKFVINLGSRLWFFIRKISTDKQRDDFHKSFVFNQNCRVLLKAYNLDEKASYMSDHVANQKIQITESTYLDRKVLKQIISNL